MGSHKNKYVIHTVRTLLGLFMLFSGVSGLLAVANGLDGIPEAMRAMTQMLLDSGIFYMIKITEVVVGLMLLFNLFPALAIIFLAPIAVGVVVFNAFVSPGYIVSGLILCAFEAYFGYVYWDKYKALFMRK